MNNVIEVEEIFFDDLVDDLVKSWAKYKSATNEKEKDEAWIDSVILLDQAMAQYLYDWRDTDISEQTETATVLIDEILDSEMCRYILEDKLKDEGKSAKSNISVDTPNK